MGRHPKTQMKVLEIVKAYYAERRAWPTFREIGAILGQDVGSVGRYVKELRAKGLLVVGPHGEPMLPK